MKTQTSMLEQEPLISNYPLFFLSCFHMAFNVAWWNVIPLIQYRTNYFSNLIGSKIGALYINSVLIFSFGLTRDFLFKYLVNTSCILPQLDNLYITYLGYILIVIGTILVAGATYKIGVVGTFNADAFGFLLPSIITTFPYNLFNSPMYVGSTMNFFGYSLIQRSPVGIILTIVIAFAYYFGTFFEK